MKYWKEIGINWRPLMAASLGLGVGYLLISYITNIFVPHLLDEFGWSKSQLSLTGITVILPALCLPIVGRFTDLFGVRYIALVGVVGAPLVFVAFSRITGEFSQYLILTAIQSIIVGGTTTSIVYSRLIAETFKLARGFAVAIAACSPAAIGAACVPILSGYIDEHGWRAGYLAVAFWTAIGGSLALLLIPGRNVGTRGRRLSPRLHWPDYLALFSDRKFQIISAGMFLCNLPYMMYGLQLNVILLERSLSVGAASLLISMFASGVIVGRLVCGLALDRFRPHIVVATVLGIPVSGLFVLAIGVKGVAVLLPAVAVLGLSLGAESDVIAFLVMRFFKVEIYSTVFGFIAGIAAISAAFGSLLLSITLDLSDSFKVFLWICVFSTIVGASIFLLLGRPSIAVRPGPAESIVDPLKGVLPEQQSG